MHITHILNGWCKFGELKLVEFILHNDAKSYAKSIDYVDGNAALMFIIRLFYGLINHEKKLEEAFQEVKLTDEETHTFQFYK
ncbi:hypothetical protein FT637_03935 [Bacillus cereus]|nr:hypothetical protein [Bacillus cereus]